MDEALTRSYVYRALPLGLVPRGLTPEVAAAYLGLELKEFLTAVEAGRVSPPTLPGGNFNQCRLDADLDRLSSIERPVPIAPLASVGPVTQTGGNAPIGPVIDVRAAADMVDAFVFVVEWGKTPRSLVRSTLEVETEVMDKCVGVILNKVVQEKMKLYEGSEYRNYYDSKYSKYYTS